MITDEGTSLTDVNNCLKQEEEVVKLENNIHNLHNMFKDLKVAVNEQGEIINSIQHSMVRSVSYVEEGTANIAKAKKYVKKFSKTKLVWALFLPVHWYLDWWSLLCSPFSYEDILNLEWVRTICHFQWSLPTGLKTNGRTARVLKWSGKSARVSGDEMVMWIFDEQSKGKGCVKRLLRQRIAVGCNWH